MGVGAEVGRGFEGGTKLIDGCDGGFVEGAEVVIGTGEAAADFRVERGESGFEIGYGDARLEFDQEVVADKDGERTGLELVRVTGGGGLFFAEEGILE